MKENRPLICDDLRDAIGEIDDFYVQEALCYRSRNASHKGILLGHPKLLYAAASVLLILSLALNGVFLGWLFGKNGTGNAPLAPSDVGTLSDLASYQSNLSLSSCLSIEKGSSSLVPPPATSLCDGKTRIVWRRNPDAPYESVVLTSKNEIQQLEKALSSSPAAQILPDRSPDLLPVSLWIVLSDGSVVSPYLRFSDGNTAVGILYDYSPEVLPSESLASLIETLIRSGTSE